MARRKALDFFKGFTQTLARTAAVANVRREEKNLGQRLKTWSRLHMGHVPVDPRYDVSGLNTNQLKAYARRLQAYRGVAIKAAGIMSPAGNLLLERDVEDYETAWAAREVEKDLWRKALQLEGVDYTKKALTLIDIDPRTGKPKPTRGGNFVLTNLGTSVLPDTQQTLERRVQQMRSWQSIKTRLDTSETNVEAKLQDNDPIALEKWRALTRAQKQYLINFEGIFDVLEELEFESPTSRAKNFMRHFTDVADAGRRDELHRLLDEAAHMQPTNPELAARMG